MNDMLTNEMIDVAIDSASKLQDPLKKMALKYADAKANGDESFYENCDVLIKTLKPLLVEVENMLPTLRDIEDMLEATDDKRLGYLKQLTTSLEDDCVIPLLELMSKLKKSN